MASFKSFLSEFGKDFKAVFSWLGSPVGQATITGTETAATAIATAVNPAAGLALAGVEALVNAALKEIISVEAVAAAAESQSGTGAQKAAAVVSAITPQVQSLLLSIGVAKPTSEQVQTVATAVNNGLVAVLNAIPSTTATA
jgi:hypothetical protein